MLLFLTGAPRSGKSYYAVDYIYNNYNVKETRSKEIFNDKGQPKIELVTSFKYDHIITNIGGFKHSLIDRCQKLDSTVLDGVLRELHSIYKLNKDKNNLDDILIDYLKSINYYKVLLVFDEAHNFFDRRLVHLIFFLSYHGHLGFDIILITQNLALIDSKYKSFAEYFIKALPTTMRFIQSNFRYAYFTSSGMTDKTKFGGKNLKFSKDVFNLYKSGDKVITKSMFRNIVIVITLLFSYIIYSFMSIDETDFGAKKKKKEEINNEVIQSSKASSDKSGRLPVNKVHNNDNEEVNEYFSFRCILGTCNGLDYYSVPVHIFNHLIKYKSLKKIYTAKYPHSTLLYFFDDKSKLNALSQYRKKAQKSSDFGSKKNELFKSDDRSE